LVKSRKKAIKSEASREVLRPTEGLRMTVLIEEATGGTTH